MEPISSSGLIVRRAAAHDAASLARLFTLFDDEPVSAEQVAARLEAVQEMEIALLAENAPPAEAQASSQTGQVAPSQSGAQIAGFACLKITPALASAAPHAEITEFYTTKERQDDNVERLLLRAVEALARQRGAESVLIFTGVKNSGAQALYRSAGYQDYALALRKRLKQA